MTDTARQTNALSSLVRRHWATTVPLVALVAVVVTWGQTLPALGNLVAGLVLIGAVLAAVHHAEIVAHRVGEPYGSLTLAVAVTVIEVGLILTLMLSGGPETASLARDTVFAAVMITCNGIVGIAVLLGSLKHGLPRFNAEGAGAALAVVATLATLTLVLPSFTTSLPGPEFSPSQLGFAAVSSLVLYVAFVFTQTVRHRSFFLPVPPPSKHTRTTEDDEHGPAPSNRTALLSLVLLLVALVAVVVLAKTISPAIEAGVVAAGIPHSFVGVVIALLVLLPEGLSSTRSALRNRMQTSFNLAYGSAMASIGLTIPAIAVASIWLPGPLVLGLGSTQVVLLVLTMLVSVLTVIPGRVTRLHGTLHLVLFAAFLFLAINP